MMAAMTNWNGTGDALKRLPGRHRRPTRREYDDLCNVAARRRGLEAPWIEGGEDPDLAETLRREEPYRRLLIVMVIGIVPWGSSWGSSGRSSRS